MDRSYRSFNPVVQEEAAVENRIPQAPELTAAAVTFFGGLVGAGAPADRA